MADLDLDMDLQLGFEGFELSACQKLDLQGVTGLIGASGSGKTLLLRIIAGLETRARGHLRYRGRMWQNDQVFVAPQHRQIGYVFQDTRLFSHMNVAQNLAYGLRWRAGDKTLPGSLIEVLELGALLDRQINRLSGGEKQRVALGRALAQNPSFLLMDEPLSGLDRARKRRILPYIRRAVALTGCPTIYVSHDQQEIDALSDRVLLLENGVLQKTDFRILSLECQVHAVQDGQVTIDLAGHQLTVPGQVPLDQPACLRISDYDSILMRGSLPANTAAIVLTGTLRKITETGHEGKTTLDLDLYGQTVSLQRDRAQICEMSLCVGDRLSLIPGPLTVV